MKKFITTIIAVLFAFYAKAEIGTHWSFDNGTMYQAIITAEMYYDGESMINSADAPYYEIGVFVGDECRGSYLPDEREAFMGGGYVYNMTVYSDIAQGEVMTFRLYNHQTEQEMDIICSTTVTFEADEQYGNPFSPLPVYFVPDPTPRYDITVTANPVAGGTVTGGGRFKEGDERTVTATPSIAYNFVNWTKGEVEVSTNASYTFTVTENADLVANFSIKTFAINATADPTAYGSVTGSGTYEYGSTVTLTATPNTGYLFYNWTKGGVEVSTNPTLTFTAQDGAEGDYVAHFATKIFTVTASASPAAGGTVTGAGQIQEGQTCTLVATPNVAYNFVNWTKGGVVVSTDATYSFEVSEDADLVANFAIKTFDIVATASPAGYGTAMGGGTYTYGTTVNLVATPNGDYIFANWTKGGQVVSTNASYSFTAVDGVEGEYIANFTSVLYDITASVTPVGSGSVSGAGSYSEGQSCTLVATANMGYKFVNWTLGGVEVSTDASYTFTVTGQAAYVAHFTEITPYWSFNTNMQYSATGTFEVTLDGVSLRHAENGHYYELGVFVGDECRSAALASEAPAFFGGGYIYQMNIYSNQQSGEHLVFRLYDHLMDEEVYVICNTDLVFNANTQYGDAVSPQVISLTSDPTPRYRISTLANPTNGGTVTGAGRYKEGIECTLVASPNTAYNFVNWTKGGEVVSMNPTYTFTVTEEAQYVANFAIKTFAIAASAEPVAYGTVTGAGTYDYGATVTLTATPNTGYLFYNWTKGGVEVSTNPTLTFTAQDGAEGNYVAHFTTKIFNITATASPVEGGTVTGDGPVQEGQTCTLVATPNTAYNFVNWTKGGVVVSTDASYTFTVEEDGDYVANFALKTFEITVSADPVTFGTVTGAGTYTYGNTVTLTATANEDYKFLNWTKGFEVVSTNATYTFTAQDGVEGEYVAHFVTELYQVTVTANPVDGGFVMGGGKFQEGESCTLRAVPKLGYEFVNWTKEDAKGRGQNRDEEVVYTLDGTVTGGSNGYAEASEITQSGITWMVTGNTTMNPWRIGGKNLSNVDRPIYSTGTLSDNITKIVVTHGTASSITVNSMTLIVSANSDFSAPTSTLSGTFEASGTTTFNRPDGVDWSNKYYKIVYNVKVNGNTNRFLQFISAEFYKDNSSGGGETIDYNNPVITFAVNDATAGYYVANFNALPLPAVPTETHWTFSDNSQYTMNITGEMLLDEVSMKNNDLVQYLEIGAFVGGVCKGSYLPKFYDLPFVTGYVYEMTLYNDLAGEQLMFRVWNHITNEEMDVTSLSNMAFVADGSFGDLMDLHPLKFETNLTPHYIVAVVANPAEGGIVEGTGSYEEGETCTLTATANYGYTFTNWTKNDAVVSTNPSYTFTALEAATYVAHFTPKDYVITVNEPAEGGTVTGGGTYSYGSQCVLTAIPAEGYHFVNWMLSGAAVSTELSYGFTVSGDATYDAVFEINSYDITAVASPDAGGVVEGAGTYNHFQTCTLIATANDRFVFENWTKGGEEVSTADTLTFMVTEAGDYVANFAPIYTIIAVDSADLRPVDIAAFITGAGDIIKGRMDTVTATPNAGYTFVGWYEADTLYTSNLEFSFQVWDNRRFVAYCTLNSYDINVSVAPDETPAVSGLIAAGTVVGDGNYHHYDTCMLVATPSLGYHFVNWTENNVEVSTSATYSFIVDGMRSLVANFELDTHLIGVTLADVTANTPEAAPAVPGTVTGANTYNYYATCTLVATPETGYHFVNWTENDAEVASTSTYEFMVTGDRNLVANFELDTHTIAVTLVDVTTDKPAAAPAVPGAVTGADTYNYYATCTLVATPETGYHFVNWTEGGVEVSTSATYEFMVTEDRNLVANFELDTHAITLSVNDVTVNKPEAAPAVPGTVTGDNTYNYYATCTVVATPEVGYHFVNWTENDAVVATTMTYEFMVTGDRNLVANFELDTHAIAVTLVDVTTDKPAAAPAVPGTVTGADTYNYYATCTLVATPETGYHFVNWTENDAVVATTLTYEFMVTEDRNLVANFELDTHVIALSVDDVTVNKPAAAPAVPGTVTGANTYNYYATCTVVATPEVGYHFVNWTEGGMEVSISATYEFMVTGDRNLVANFELDTHTIAVTLVDVTTDKPAAAPTIPGVVTGADTYNYYATCTLVATPETGYHFVNWTENDAVVATTLTYEFMVTGDRNLVANFELDTHVITLSVDDVTVNKPAAAPAVPGTVTGDNTYNYYATCTVVATPEVGYHFVNWTENGNEVSASATYEFMVTGDRNLVANFELDTHAIAVTLVDVTTDKPAAAPTIPGMVTGADTYNYYATCTLVATPETGYHFVNWTENDAVVATTATYEFMVTGDRNLVANFELDTHTIAVTLVDVTTDKPAAAPAVPGTVTGADTYNYYATCTLVATPETGYHFVNWTENDAVVATTLTYEFMVTEDRNLVANFELDTHVIALSVDDVTVNKPAAAPAVPGTVTGDNTYNYYATCTLVATPETGYHFVNWTEGGMEVSTSATYEFMVTGDRNLVANFELDTHTIAVTLVDVTTDKPAAAPTIPGVVTGVDTYNYYATCTLVATPETGYHFVNWTENDAVVATTLTYEFMVTGDRNLVANFELDTHVITLSVDDVTVNKPAAAPAVPGTATGADTYNYYAMCTVVATPEVGYHFVNWTEGGMEVSISATYEFMVTGDRNLVANFELDTHAIAVTLVDVTTDKPAAAPAIPGVVTGADTYNYYATCTLVATPETGYHFVNWTENDAVVATTLTYEFMVTEDRNLVANFELDTHAITLSVDDVTVNKPEAAPAVPGTVTGADTYNNYAMCTVVATPEVGYHFVNWTEGGMEVSISATYEFMVTGDRNLVANFELDTHAIAVTLVDVTTDKPAAAPAIPGVVTGADTYNYYATCTLVATPETGYHFVNWTENDAVVATTLTYEFMVTEDRNLVANFELDSYAITATITPAVTPAASQLTAAGTVTGTGTYNHYATCELTATPATGYHFVNWTEGGLEVSTAATYSFMVTEARELVANFEINSYDINVAVVPETTPAAGPAVAGTVTGAGNFEHYATCELTASPSEGYHFVNWTEGGLQVATTLTYSFMVTGTRNLVANFELDSYDITVTVNPSTTPAASQLNAAGTVTGAGTYNHYATCELTATPATGYHFVNWTEGTQVVSTDATYSFMVTEARDLVANFEINSYQIEVSANPSNYGTVTGGGTYNHFDNCTLVATASEGHTFVNWTKDGEDYSTNNTISFEVTGPATFVAYFINRYTINVTANLAVGGTVTGGGIFDEGSNVTLTATPATGYHFVNWTLNGQAVSTNSTYSFVATASGNYVANFEINSYVITVAANPTAGGIVNGGNTYNHFQNCTLTATANTGYTFVNWTKNGMVVSTSTTYAFTVTEAGDYVANFSLNSYQIAATMNPTDAGTISGTGSYNHFEMCTLTAQPSSSYLFVNWTENGNVVSTNPTISFEVNGPRTLVANCIPNTYEITATASPFYGGAVEGAGTYYYNTSCTLTATANTGFHFVNWTKDGQTVSTNSALTFTVTENADYVANFAANQYTVVTMSVPAEGGTTTGGGTFDYGTTCALNATPNEGYHFVNWTDDNGVVLSTSPVYMFNVVNHALVIAHFEINTYNITASADPTVGGTVEGAGTYEYGATCTLTATANTGYTFVNWTKDGQVVTTNASFSVTVTEAAAYIAHFNLNSYEITATSNPSEGGTVTGTGTYEYGATCTLTASANTGYTFIKWTKNGQEVSTNASYSFTVTEAAAYIAHFELNSYVITAEADPEEGGEVTGNGVYNHGETVTMTATANPDYRFVNWTENGEVVSDEATFTFTADGDRQLVAHFESTVGVMEYGALSVTVYPNPAEDKLFIEMDRPADRCEIYSINGALIQTLNDCGDKFEIEVSNLMSGTYIVRVVSDSMVKNIRFVKL